MGVTEDLQQLSYRELQQRARAVGLKANGKATDIVERLLDHERKHQLKNSTSRPIGKEAAALLSAAAGTPLPAHRRPEQGTCAASTIKQSVSRRQQFAPPAPVAGSALSSLVYKMLIVTAAVVAVAALAAPYCEQHDCRAQVHSLPGVVVEAATAAYSHLRSHLFVYTDAVQSRWQSALGRLLSLSQEGGRTSRLKPPACHFDAATALKRIAPGGVLGMSQWAAAATLSSHGMEVKDKASVGLVVCAAASNCDAAIDAVSHAVTGNETCIHHLHGQQLGKDKGALQSKLAYQLRAMPNSVVVLHRVDQMSPSLIPVLVNALSEQGAFQDSGQAVPTAGAIFVLTALIPADVFVHEVDDVLFHQEVKKHLVADFVMRALAEDKDTVATKAKALRRRIDATILASPNASAAQPSLQKGGAFQAET